MYSSLAEPLLQDESESLKGQTVFVHLPQDHNDEAIALAQHITATYIEGLADDALYNDTM